MLKINKQNSAEEDLIDIWLYSLGQWDESTADKYLDRLNQAIQKLLDNRQRQRHNPHKRKTK